MTVKKKMRTIIIFLGMTVSFFVPVFFVSALTISPARIEIAGDPGETIEGEYLLQNEQKETKTFYWTAENFESQGDTGAPKFIGAQEGLATWIDSSKQVTLQPGQEVKLKYKITIPADAEPGGYFATNFWGTTNPEMSEGESGVMIGAMLSAPLVLLRVNGDFEEGGGIEEFETLDKKRFFITLPIDLMYRFKNTGADRVKPVGEIAIKNTVWLTTSVLNANPQDGNVLPQSTRKYTIAWNGVDDNDRYADTPLKAPDGFFFGPLKYQFQHFALGMYTAQVRVSYGATNNLTDERSFVFFVFPWQLMLTVLVGAIVVWRGIKGYNAMIVRSAQKTTAPVARSSSLLPRKKVSGRIVRK